MNAVPRSPAEMASMLEQVDYLADESTAMAAYLALAMPRPLLLEGDPGVGKTALATALARALGLPMVRLQCYEGITAAQALYDWDFPRQLLHLQAVRSASSPSSGSDLEASEAPETRVYSRRFLIPRPLLEAIESSPAVLLVDEIDRADDEFEAFLLELLSDYALTIPEVGRIEAAVPPVVVITSNRTREVHDALKRRCLYHWVEHPDLQREVAIIRRQVPAASERLSNSVGRAVAALRDQDLLKPPGIAESIDWAHALVTLGTGDLDSHTAVATLAAVLKYREDQLLIASDGGSVLAAALGGQ